MTYGHLQADCLYTGISSGPLPFTFIFISLSVSPVGPHEDVDGLVDALVADSFVVLEMAHARPQQQHGGLRKDARVEMHRHAPRQHVPQRRRHETPLHTTTTSLKVLFQNKCEKKMGGNWPLKWMRVATAM